jgi:hypothetical protein
MVIAMRKKKPTLEKTARKSTLILGSERESDSIQQFHPLLTHGNVDGPFLAPLLSLCD